MSAVTGLRGIYNGASFVQDEVAIRTSTAIDRIVEEVEGTALAVFSCVRFAVQLAMLMLIALFIRRLWPSYREHFYSVKRYFGRCGFNLEANMSAQKQTSAADLVKIKAPLGLGGPKGVTALLQRSRCGRKQPLLRPKCSP